MTTGVISLAVDVPERARGHRVRRVSFLDEIDNVEALRMPPVVACGFRPKARASSVEDDPAMDETRVRYHGLKPIPPNEPVIDFEADDGHVLDLHNGGDVLGIELASPSDLVIRLTYVEPARWTADAAPEREVQLRFACVRNLTAMQDENHADEASSTFEDLTVWPSPSPRFMLRTGNFELRFDAASVHLQHRPAG